METSYAVLTAAGAGTRLGSPLPKALVPLAGEPLVVHAARGLAQAGITGIVITAPEEHLESFRRLFPNGVIPTQTIEEKSFEIDSTGQRNICASPWVHIVAGSPKSRQASVYAGLQALTQHARDIAEDINENTPVLVHDAARALTPVDVTQRVIETVCDGYAAVIPGLPVSDTIKETRKITSTNTDDLGQETAKAASENLHITQVIGTPDRARLVSVQTPQGFTWKTLFEAHQRQEERAGDETTASTDDAGLIESQGGTVYVVPGDPRALKVTTAVDLAVAELLLNSQAQ